MEEKKSQKRVTIYIKDENKLAPTLFDPYLNDIINDQSKKKNPK